ncbi:MAG: tetratricopeptide repeat protein [Bryobacterales bacterium]|nr:tetratricopeptide repeat protein [Bryobacterales bacterium]
MALSLAPDPAYSVLEKAYSCLAAKEYDSAVSLFRQAATLSPQRADIHKNLAYTLLKVGETEGARDSFKTAMTLDPKDQTSALEFAFLAHETGQTRLARLTFDKIRQSGNTVAEQAFQNIDKPLAEGISRWLNVLRNEMGNFSAHQELARLAELRNESKLAAEHYLAAWKLRPTERHLLVALGRVHLDQNEPDLAMPALLAAARSGNPRAIEQAKGLLPNRYPYVYEFEQALALDPTNVELRRELAYLHLAMGQPARAQREFEALLQHAPNDRVALNQLALLKGQPASPRDPSAAAAPITQPAPPPPPKPAPEPTKTDTRADLRAMADKSYQNGFLKDALKYYTELAQADPNDHQALLKLGWTQNQLHNDREAIRYFDRARLSSDPNIAAEAQRAYDNLRPQFEAVRNSAWILPFYSSRWKDTFAYGQLKTEIRLPFLHGLRPYASLRLIGNLGGSIQRPGEVYPQYLSESAVIPAVGIATPVHKGLMAWAEAGYAMSYLTRRDNQPQQRADYRGGVSFSRGFGRLLGAGSSGLFFENHGDAVFVSRFNNSLILYSQNKLGFTYRKLQLYWNGNLTADPKRQYWANFVETGPGLRFRAPFLPPALVFSVDVLRGQYLIRQGNPNPMRFHDVRAGFWYAFSR